jgi:hypothetical protein
MVKFNTSFLRFRIRQSWKFVKDIPFPYLVVLLVVAAVAGRVLYAFMEYSSEAWMVGGGLLLLLLLFHLRRKDYHFVCLAEASAWRVFCMDYLLLSLPVLILEAVRGRGQGFIVPAIIFGCVGISLIKQPYYRRTRGFPVPRFIPSEAFEIRSGFRRYGGWLLLFYAGAWVGLLFRYVSFVSLWFLTIFLAEFFRDCEPEVVLCSREYPVKRFISGKIATNSGLYAILIAPVCLLYTVVYPADWWLAWGFFIAAMLNVALLVLMKYALYRPKHKIVSGQTGLFLSLGGILIPFLLPFTMLLLIRYAVLSRRNLSPYLYVYD